MAANQTRHVAIAENDRLWLKKIADLSNQALQDLDQLEHDGIKVFLDILQKHGLFGTSLLTEISTLYHLLIKYHQERTTGGRESIKHMINICMARIYDSLSGGLPILNNITELSTHFIQREDLLMAAAESFCQKRAGADTTNMQKK